MGVFQYLAGNSKWLTFLNYLWVLVGLSILSIAVSTKMISSFLLAALFLLIYLISLIIVWLGRKLRHKPVFPFTFKNAINVAEKQWIMFPRWFTWFISSFFIAWTLGAAINLIHFYAADYQAIYQVYFSIFCLIYTLVTGIHTFWPSVSFATNNDLSEDKVDD